MEISTRELLLLSQVAGILLLLCTVALLWFRRIYIDAETKKPIEFEFPVIGKLRTQSPAFSLIIVATFLIIFPISKAGQDMINVEGVVDMKGKTSSSVSLLVVAVPNSQQTLSGSTPFHMTIPKIKDAVYHVKFIENGQILDEKQAEPCSDGFYRVKVPFTFQQSQMANIQPAKSIKEISDEELRRMGIIR